MELGIHNEEVEIKAMEGGLEIVFNICMMEEHTRLL
jgi:predicted CoA-binding protein